MRILRDSGYLEDRYEVDTNYYWCLLSGFVLAVLIPWGYPASQSSGFVDEAVSDDRGFRFHLPAEARDFFSFMEFGPTLGSVQPALHWLQRPVPRG